MIHNKLGRVQRSSPQKTLYAAKSEWYHPSTFPVGHNSAVVRSSREDRTMIGMYSRRVAAVALAAALFACAYVHAAQDDLVRAKELYLTAEYDEALAMLNRLGQTSPAGERTEVETYRIFCLLALDKRDEARGAIQ